MRRTLAIASFLLVVGMSLPLQSTSSPAGSSAAENWIAAWNSHDTAKWATYFTSDIYYEDVTFAEISRGSEEAKKFASEFFEAVPDLKLELEGSSVQGDHGSIQWILSGTDKGVYKTGKKFKVRGVSIITVKNGKISRSLDYYDAATIMKQVGLLPAS
jgi:steroid delta-isomerase-like uncharacterized protein